MVTDDEPAPFGQTYIALFVVVFVIVAATAGAVLCVALRELSFYSGWNARFKAYSERKKAPDEKLGD